MPGAVNSPHGGYFKSKEHRCLRTAASLTFLCSLFLFAVSENLVSGHLCEKILFFELLFHLNELFSQLVYGTNIAFM